jgi:hypothetical protein
LPPSASTLGDIVNSIRLLFQRLWHLGFDLINGLWGYFLLGAVIVIPVWPILRFIRAPKGDPNEAG